jgi:predicted transcriptional regulator
MANEPYNLLARYQMLEAALGDFRLTRADCSVLAVILSHVDQDGEAWPGITRITKRAGVSRRTAIRAISALEAADYFCIKRDFGRVNTYQVQEINPAPTGDTSDTGLGDDW